MASRGTTQMSIQKGRRIYDPWDGMAKEEDGVIDQIQHAQSTIYDIFMDLAKTWQPEDVLSLFRQIFIHCVDSSDSDLAPALYTLLKLGEEEHFHFTLNRVCYILINNWESARQPDAIPTLIEILSTVSDLEKGTSIKLRTLRKWLTSFINSPTFKELELYSSRYRKSSHWTHRYTSYLLASQSLNKGNSQEQRQVANSVSNQLNREFKRDLALYTIQAEKRVPAAHTHNNPTLLGEHIVPLIKKILAKKGEFSCQNLANIFLAQSKQLKFKQFKTALLDYLVFSMGENEMTQSIRYQLSNDFSRLYCHYDERSVDKAIALRTANHIIGLLTVNKQGTPSPLLTLLLGKGYALTLAILLLKVVMISPKSRALLDGKIGLLVQAYEDCPEDECRWLIKFLEIQKVTFTIYSDQSTNYDLVKMSKTISKPSRMPSPSSQRPGIQRPETQHHSSQDSSPQPQKPETSGPQHPAQPKDSDRAGAYRIFSKRPRKPALKS